MAGARDLSGRPDPFTRDLSGRPDPSAWGIAPGYHDVRGNWIEASPAAVEAALAAMGATTPAPPDTATWVVRAGDPVVVPWPARLVTEDGGTEDVGPGPLPPVPIGYHRLDADQGSVRLIVCPERCPPPPARTWGWALQLYALRSRASWGIGDLHDLARAGQWASRQGAGLLLVNPLHAPAPTPHQAASPYFPTSRRWGNPLYLRVEDVPGAELVDLEDIAAAGRALDTDRRIDRDRVWRLKREALARIWAALDARAGPDIDRWASAEGAALRTFATYMALAERHGDDWRAWPAELRHPHRPAVAAFAAGPGAAQVRFHVWLQWLLDAQLAAAAASGVVVAADLALGADPGGADGWEWQDVQAEGVTVGAPPDEFSPGGQDWGFPPFDPWRLRQAGYQPLIDLLRAAFRHVGGLRIDHVAGLFRLFWVPEATGPADAVYVRYPWADLCNIVALESHRAGAFVMGEDLGTVEPWVRGELSQRGLLSYRLLWFEDEPPSRWPEAAVGAVTTHDLPTVSGLWTGADAAARQGLGLVVDEAAEAGLRRRLAATCGEQADGLAAALGAYQALAESPCAVVTATFEDALGVEERPNIPGTGGERPNWSLALPLVLEEIEEDPRPQAIGALMRKARPEAQAWAGARSSGPTTTRTADSSNTLPG